MVGAFLPAFAAPCCCWRDGCTDAEAAPGRASGFTGFTSFLTSAAGADAPVTFRRGRKYMHVSDFVVCAIQRAHGCIE